jgi:ribonuclease BN (tRNA processing enzyme)
VKALASRIALLGTGTPNADPDRSGPAVAVIVGETPYLVDCGPGVVRRAAAAGIAVSRLARLFVTHLHSDHTAGYPDVILTPWVLERDVPLEVYGPSGIDAMTEHVLAAYARDVDDRITGLEPANTTGCRVHSHEIGPRLVYEDDNVRVEAFRVNHGSLEAYGYRFHAPDRTIVISGDTAPFEGAVAAYQGCDLLIHEVQSARGLARRSPAWRRYHSAVHTTTHELAEIASQAQPGLLVLYHQLFHGVSAEALLHEVTDRYDGAVVSGKDLDVF